MGQHKHNQNAISKKLQENHIAMTDLEPMACKKCGGSSFTRLMTVGMLPALHIRNPTRQDLLVEVPLGLVCVACGGKELGRKGGGGVKEKLIPVHIVAQKLGVSKRTVQRMIQRGSLRTVEISIRVRRVKESELHRLLEPRWED